MPPCTLTWLPIAPDHIQTEAGPCCCRRCQWLLPLPLAAAAAATACRRCRRSSTCARSNQAGNRVNKKYKVRKRRTEPFPSPCHPQSPRCELQLPPAAPPCPPGPCMSHDISHGISQHISHGTSQRASRNPAGPLPSRPQGPVRELGCGTAGTLFKQSPAQSLLSKVRWKGPGPCRASRSVMAHRSLHDAQFLKIQQCMSIHLVSLTYSNLC